MISLDHQQLNECDFVVLSGRMVASVSDSVADDLVAIFDSGCGVLHIDMCSVEFIDSKGLSALVAVMKRVHKDEGEFVLMNISDEVRTLLELTRLHEVFDIRSSDEAESKRAAGM